MLTSTIERNLELSRQHEGGASYRVLAGKYGISPARVQQVCDAIKRRKVPTQPYVIRRVDRTMALARGRMAELGRQLALLEKELAELDLILDATLIPEVAQESDGMDEGSSSTTAIDMTAPLGRNRLAS